MILMGMRVTTFQLTMSYFKVVINSHFCYFIDFGYCNESCIFCFLEPESLWHMIVACKCVCF